MEKPKIKILYVEDRENFITLLAMLLDEEVEVLGAQTLEEGKRIFEENSKDLALVVIDACVPGKKPNSMGLIEEIRKNGFKKPIVAKSSKRENLKALVDAGASHKVSVPPMQNVSELVMRLLKEAEAEKD